MWTLKVIFLNTLSKLQKFSDAELTLYFISLYLFACLVFICVHMYICAHIHACVYIYVDMFMPWHAFGGRSS